MVWNIKFIKYREIKLIVTKYVQNVCHWHKHKHVSAFAIGQLRQQSATTPSRVTHAVDAVTAHRCNELWSHTHVAEWQTRWHNPPDWGLVSLVVTCLALWNLEWCVLAVQCTMGRCAILLKNKVISRHMPNDCNHAAWTECLDSRPMCHLSSLQGWRRSVLCTLFRNGNVLVFVSVCDVSFSLGSASTLFRWGGHFCHVCVKHFFLLTTVQKL